ncbi:MAG: hypothetical protein WBC22_05840 [Sedimentisphaerales bacterium]
MNKLIITFILGLMSCALYGCMSEQEWKAWQQKQDRKRLEWLFSSNGVRYPGTREEYVAAHSAFEMDDFIASLEASATTPSRSRRVGSSPRSSTRLTTLIFRILQPLPPNGVRLTVASRTGAAERILTSPATLGFQI